MYALNRSGIIAVNKNKANIDTFSYNEKEYRKQFEDLQREIYPEINLSITVTCNKMALLHNNIVTTQIIFSSYIGIMNNIAYNPFVQLQNIYNPNRILPLINKRFVDYTFKKFFSKHGILISHNIVSDLLNHYIQNFYADYISLNSSNFSINDIGTNILPSSVSVYSCPSEMKFDGEGSICKKNVIIEKGMLKGIIAHKKSAKDIEAVFLGNADIEDPNKIKHGQLELHLSSNVSACFSFDIFLEECHQVIYNPQSDKITATIRYKKNTNVYLTKITFTMKEFISTIRGIGKKKWHNSVFCSDVYLTSPDFIQFI